MDVDARLAVGVLGHHAGNERNTQVIKNVGQAIHGDRGHARIAKHDLIQALGRRVAIVRRLGIFTEQPAQIRESRPGTG